MTYADNNIPTVTLEDVKDAVDGKKPAIILDVRTPEEVIRGKISGSINLPLDNLSDNIERVIPDKNSVIYVYCLTASRSAAASNFMRKSGYTNVFNMQYGLLGWRAKFYPVV